MTTLSNVTYDFTGCKFVITGASSGIGRQIALELAKANAFILAIARRSECLKSLAEEYPKNIIIAAADVRNILDIEIHLDNFVKQYGKINGCVHAAGINGLTPLKAYDKNLALDIMDISFWAGVDIVQLCNKNKYAEKGASNVLFSSVAAITGEKGMFAYSAAKAAIKTAVKSFAKELSAGQRRINTVSPGWVHSEMTEKVNNLDVQSDFSQAYLLGTGKVTDISGVVLFLLSDRAGWITGTNVVIDGGFLTN